MSTEKIPADKNAGEAYVLGGLFGLKIKFGTKYYHCII